MIKVTLPITICVKGPFISQSTEPGAYGLDMVQARDSDDRPIIPGTHVTGKLRQAWEELNSAISTESDSDFPPTLPNEAEIKKLLGNQATGENLEPHRKELYFSDFVLAQPVPNKEKVRYRIEVDKERGAVKEQALAMIESIIESGELAKFKGEVTFLAESEDKAEEIEQKILTGLSWVDQIGAFGSIGFGKVEEILCKGPKTTEICVEKAPLEETEDDEILELAIEPLSPFCIAKKHMADNNLFESVEYIPGNAILGALKATLDKISNNGTHEDFKELYEHFNSLRVLHAFAGSHCHTRPVTPPLSLIKANGTLYDAALLEGPCIIGGKAPAFSIDWKDNSDVKEKFGWASLRRELRIRTAIDPESLRSAEERLFSYEMIVPDCHLWLTKVYFGSIKDPKVRKNVINQKVRKNVINQFKTLIKVGLLGFGKAKTVANITCLPKGTIKKPTQAKSLCSCTNREIVMTLQTPALLLSPEIDGLTLNENTSHKELFNAYSQIWDKLSDGKLKLKRFFARQYLSGGKYQFARFMKKSTGNGSKYYPWILTDAGSVFVFNIKEGCQEVVDDWLQNGLPLPKNVIQFYGVTGLEEEQWKQCPFIPQNGFGEVAVNLEIHWDAIPPYDVEKISTPCED